MEEIQGGPGNAVTLSGGIAVLVSPEVTGYCQSAVFVGTIMK